MCPLTRPGLYHLLVAIEVMSYQEWLNDADLLEVRMQRITRFVAAFPELAGKDLRLAIGRQGRRGGLYNRAMRAAVVLARNVVMSTGDVLSAAAITQQVGKRLINMGLDWE